MPNGYLKNFSYLFVPFTVEDADRFPSFFSGITAENGWNVAKIENRYLHRYVLEKLSWNEENYNTHFMLDAKYAEANGLHLGACWYGLNAKTYKGEKDVDFRFQIANVELFVFSTSICILAIELRFQDDDPRKIAAAQYYLRKISTERIRPLDGEVGRKESFMDISKRILSSAAGDIALDFFFYATPDNEKANFLTYIDVPEKESYEEDLFYLKWCYNDKFDYNEYCGDDSENYQASKTTLWGISVSAAVCLVYRSDEQRSFIENVFQNNFRKQYLLTYILLLHQKYMMYLFLTKKSAGLEGNLVQLEKYKAQLYDFESHYMFTYITEVPQYQRFYQKVRRLFMLEDLFRDVQEPLLQLTEIKKQKEEQEQRAYDYRINTALTTLSLLTIVSALTDATGITANLTWFIPEACAKIIQLVALVGVAIVSIIMLIRLLFLKKH